MSGSGGLAAQTLARHNHLYQFVVAGFQQSSLLGFLVLLIIGPVFGLLDRVNCEWPQQDSYCWPHFMTRLPVTA